MTTLAVTFHTDPVMTYADNDTPESLAAAESESFDGHLTLNGADGSSQWLTATDDAGKPVDLSSLVRVSPRAETTREALEAMVDACPDQRMMVPSTY